jgi:hypothetical protein
MAAKLHEKRKTGCLTFEAFFNELKIFSRQPNERQKLKEEEWNLETSTTSLRGELLVALRFGIQLVCPCV